MEIILKGKPKEIAALVIAVQERRKLTDRNALAKKQKSKVFLGGHPLNKVVQTKAVCPLDIIQEAVPKAIDDIATKLKAES